MRRLIRSLVRALAREALAELPIPASVARDWLHPCVRLAGWIVLHDLDSVEFGVGPTVRAKKPSGGTDGYDKDGPPAKHVSDLDLPPSKSLPFKVVERWLYMSTWEEESTVERWLGDVEPGTWVRVDIVASVPDVGDWIKIGRNKYTYTDGPDGSSEMVRKILAAITEVADAGIAGAETAGQAPAGASSAWSIVSKIINGIPDAYDRWRLKKWSGWREGLAATKNLRSPSMTVAHKDSAVCQFWRYEIKVPAGGGVGLPMVNGTVPPYYLETLGSCLSGQPPSVFLDGLHLNVKLMSPDSPRESRYDVIVYEA